MRVVIHTGDILAEIPELVPAFRALGEDMPKQIELEAALTRTAQLERECRIKFPDYWEILTGMEWIIWVALQQEDGGKRKDLEVLAGNEYTHIDSGTDKIMKSNLIDVHMKNLRKKLYLAGNKHHVRTKRGWGYIVGDGPNPDEGYVQKNPSIHSGMGYVRRIQKKVDAEGSTVIRPRWRNSKNHLNPVEFGYLKEMKMDDITKEEAAKRLCLTMEEIESPWNCRDWAEYQHKIRPWSRFSIRPKKKPVATQP